MKFQLILFLIIVVVESKKAPNKRIGNVPHFPPLREYPCKDRENILLTYESGLPPGEENQYSVHISEKFPRPTNILINFDSEVTEVTVTVNLTHASSASKSTAPVLGTFIHLSFIKEADGIDLEIKGPPTGIIPHITSLKINNVEYCTEPNFGILDGYIKTYQYAAENVMTVPDETCGRRKVQHTELITNGLPTKPGDWPWHAAIYRIEKSSIAYKCGGTLISKNHILTAAHCVTDRGALLLPEIFRVILGKYNLFGGDTTTQEKEVYEMIAHENFNHKNVDNDIALMKLKTQVTYDDYVQPACLWNFDVYKRLPSDDIFGTVVGWGIDHTDQLSSQLRQATMPKIVDSTCIKSNPVFFSEKLNDRKFCAGYTNGTSACNGDSGGGFVVFVPDTAGDNSPDATGAWHLLGVVSVAMARRNVALCDPYQYALFTDVSQFSTWLEKHVK